MKIKVIVRTDRVGSETCRFIDVGDEATEEEISEEVSEYALVSGMVSIDWQKA